ncbi:MAG: NifB/NifX family molybdenum-iron cluster-binding protein [Clostridia bacterium]|nr:NifB/NifX family molybdenum-iron cluster-binding protein [Clostridia bacterium]
MRIAVTYQNEEIFQHFGHSEQFKVYDVENGEITYTTVISTVGSGHGALAGVLASIRTDVLICGGIGAGAQNALASAGIQLFGGVSGSCDDAVKAYLSGELNYNPDIKCNHHSHEEGHNCGEHSCGSHEDGHSCHN